MMQALVELAVTVPLLLLLLRFPTSMLGRLLGFHQRAHLENMPSVK